MKENNLNESPIENNDINENQNQVKIENKSDNKEITIQSEDNEKLPLKESNQNQNQVEKNNSENSSEKDDDKEEKKKAERISLTTLFNQEIEFNEDTNQGKTGLVNIGNTCFMNSALQCLSNCYELTKYFLLDYYINDINPDNKLGTGGQVATIYRKLLEDLWNSEEEYINPSYFKKIFVHFVHKFSGYAQQDSNEFLIYLLDKIHEDLNTITVKPYIEMEEKKKRIS